MSIICRQKYSWMEAVMSGNVRHWVLGIGAAIAIVAVSAGTAGAFTPEATHRDGKYSEKKALPDADLKGEREDITGPNEVTLGAPEGVRASQQGLVAPSGRTDAKP
jgi:hypothetical protein